MLEKYFSSKSIGESRIPYAPSVLGGQLRSGLRHRYNKEAIVI
jgi:hypothetical protein